MKRLLVCGAGAIMLLAACGHHHDNDGHEHKTGHEMKHTAHSHKEAAGDEIVLPAEKARAAGVAVQVAERKAFAEVTAASGQIMPAQGQEKVVVATVSGVVHLKTPLTEGRAVEKGQTLLSLTSRHMAEGDPVERARIAFEISEAEYLRMKALVDKKIVSEKEFAQARQRFEEARLSYRALSEGHEAGRQFIKASEAGRVKEMLVKEGDFVTAGQPVLTLAQDGVLYLRAEVSERYFSRMKDVSNARFIPSYEEKAYSIDHLDGRLLSVGQTAAESTHLIPVTFQFDNPGNMLPGAYAEVFLLGKPQKDVIALPLTAITEEQGQHFVYIQLDADCYRKQAVTLGANDGQEVEIRSGLHGGERVVTIGAYQVKLASASHSIPGHTHNH